MYGLSDTMFARPPVFATAKELAQYRAIVCAPPVTGPGFELFKQEVGRLTIVPEPTEPPYVRLGSLVAYKDLRSKRERLVRIVPPGQSDGDENTVSLFSPIGAALLGLAPEAIFRWEEPDGSLRAVKVLMVEDDAK